MIVSRAVTLPHRLPVVPWLFDVNVHWQFVREAVLEHCASGFPTAKRKKRQVYVSEAAWAIVQRKDLKSQIRWGEWLQDLESLQACFRAWQGHATHAAPRAVDCNLRNMRIACPICQRHQLGQTFRKPRAQESQTSMLQCAVKPYCTTRPLSGFSMAQDDQTQESCEGRAQPSSGKETHLPLFVCLDRCGWL